MNIENQTLKDNCNIMQIICNIQQLSKITNEKYTFKILENKTYRELSKIQDDLLKKYNQIKRK